MIGGFSLILCGLPLFDEPSISADLAGAIRVIAWWGVIKSLIICWSPGWLIPLGERMLSGPARCRMWGVVAIAAGAVFAWAGFKLVSG